MTHLMPRTGRSRPALVLLAGLLGLGVLIPVVPAAPAVAAAPAGSSGVDWLCRPGQASPDCRGDLTTTVRSPDGSERVVPSRSARRPPVDCFYVYPTASEQPTPNALPVPESSVRGVVRQQAQRFSSVCRVFVPLYRQRTLAALAAEDGFSRSQRSSFNQTAYADVLAAWRSYLRRDSRGRDFVLVGHSQGSRLLRKLVREEIDPRPVLRRRLVSAILPGADVVVRRGSDRGGDFRHTPLCTRPGQRHCVLAWSTYARVPEDSRFGRPPTADSSPGLGLPVGRRLQVACTNPASLAANRRVRVHGVGRSEPYPGVVIGALLLRVYGGPTPTARTPWVVPEDRYTARCETRQGARVLSLRPVGGSRRLQAAPDETWGLHLLDVTLVLDDVLRVLRTQIAAQDGVRAG